MIKITSTVLSIGLLLAGGSALADGTKKDTMAKDKMAKDEMKKDSMKKDAMAKDGMKKDEANAFKKKIEEAGGKVELK